MGRTSDGLDPAALELDGSQVRQTLRAFFMHNYVTLSLFIRVQRQGNSWINTALKDGLSCRNEINSFESGCPLSMHSKIPMRTLDRESIASQCMDIHRNPRISKWISIKAWITELISIKTWISTHGYLLFTGIHCGMSLHGYPYLMWISTFVWIIEDWHPKIMDIHVDIRGFLEIHAWICYGFSDQGNSLFVPKAAVFC